MNRIALDTNTLLRLAEPQHPLHTQAADALEKLRRAGRVSVLLPQVVYEFWAVSTRTSAANGLGMTASQADQLIDQFTRRMPLLRDERSVYEHWRDLGKKYAVTGVNSHDMRIVAAMIRHGVSTLLTSNQRDFLRYGEIQVLTPEAVCQTTWPDNDPTLSGPAITSP